MAENVAPRTSNPTPMLIVGNWKMNTTRPDARALAEAVAEASSVTRGSSVRVTVCPPFVNIETVVSAVSGSDVLVGGQNLHQSESGAYTGEISGRMLRAAGCSLVILGHSERRQYFGEDDTLVNEKCVAAQTAGLIPIVCVGETLEQRKEGMEEDVVSAQIAGAFKGICPEGEWLPVVAYEPVWAIGTGLTATPEQAQWMHALIRSSLATEFGAEVANRMEILYGGSMKPGNAEELLSQPDISGGLIGGASLKVDDFASIIRAAVHVST